MKDAVTDTSEMIRHMAPVLVDGTFQFRSFTTMAEATPYLGDAKAVFHEAEGVSLLMPCEPDSANVMRHIMLLGPCSLDAVGLTAAASAALAAEGIPCNMIAAYHHDHIFVPAEDAKRAVEILRARAAQEA